MSISILIIKDHLQLLPSLQANDLYSAIVDELPASMTGQTNVSSPRNIDLVDEITKADYVLLPLRWNDYVGKGLINLTTKQVKQAASEGKRVIFVSDGDYTANVPYPNSIIFERCAYASRQGYRGNMTFSMPAFIDDYVEIYCNGEQQIRQKSSKPVIGFCGQAGGTIIDYIRREIVNKFSRISYNMGLRKWEPSPFEPTWFRHKVLSSCENKEKVSTNFIARSRYRAGYLVKNKDQYHPTRLEFVQNILDSDYTICVRGGGNFSVRFYETLCLGRIPIFINTDCLLPYDKLIDYQKFCVWIEPDEIPYLVEKVADFHASLSLNEFVDLQIECRHIWKTWLSRQSYFSNIHRLFLQI